MSLFDAKNCREERANIVKQIETIIVGAKKENRSLTSEEQQTFDRLDNQAEDLKSKAEGYERIEKFENLSLQESRQEIKKTSFQARPLTTKRDYSNALKAWLSAGIECREEWAEAANRIGLNAGSKTLTVDLEERQQVAGTASAGGYLVPQDNELMTQVQQALKWYAGPRDVCRILRTEDGSPLPYPLNSDFSNVGELTAENGTINEIDMTFSSVTFNAYKVDSGLVKVSWELLQDAAIDITAFIGESLGIRIGRKLVTLETTGTGSGQQQGVVNGSTLGYLNHTSTSVSYTDLTELEHSVDPAYRKNSCWMFNDQTYKILKQLLDENNRPLFYSSLEGMADYNDKRTLLGYPFVINTAMANMGAGNKPILFGDFQRGYLVRDVKQLTLVRLDELLALNGMTGFLAWLRSDAQCTNAGGNPTKYLQNSSSGS